MSKRTGIVRRPAGTIAVARSPESTEPQNISDGIIADAEGIGQLALPRDHPKWARDRFVVSSATQALLSRVKPVVIRLLGFWDHRVHRLEIENATIQIDDSGAYRCV